MDNLENLYRKSFEGFERKPKADFWDKLEPIIPPKPPRNNPKLGLLLAYCAGLLSMLLLLVGYQFFTNQKSNNFISSLPIQLEKIGTTERIDLLDLQKEKQPLSEKDLNIKTSNINERTTAKDETIGIAGTTQFVPFTKPYIPITTFTEFKRDLTPHQELISTSSNEKIKQFSIIDNKTSNKEVSPQKSKKWKVRKLVRPFLPKNYAALQIEKGLFSKNSGQIRKQKKGLSNDIEYAFLGLQYTPFSLGSVKIEKYPSGTTFSQSASVHQTKGFDISVGVQLENNWFVQTGFSNHKYALKQTHRHPILTNSINAIVEEQGIVQEYDFAGLPIVEPIQQRLEVWTPTNEFLDGATFWVQSTTQQSLKFWNVYFNLGYRFRLSPRWQLTPKLGFGAAWGEKGRVTLSSINLLDTIQKIRSASIANTNVTSFNFIEGLASTELAYRFSRHISLTAAPQYRFGFKPFFNNYQRSTKHRFGQLQLGIRIHLH